MQKPATLRAAIVKAAPEYGRDAERLQMYVDGGTVKSPMTPDRGFGMEYTLNILITDCTTDPAVICLAINDWLRVNQPDLLAPTPTAGYKFEADILNIHTVDLEFKLKLTEQVAMVSDGNGGFALQYVGEPDLGWLMGLPTLSTPAAQLVAATGFDTTPTTGGPTGP